MSKILFKKLKINEKEEVKAGGAVEKENVNGHFSGFAAHFGSCDNSHGFSCKVPPPAGHRSCSEILHNGEHPGPVHGRG